MGAGKRRKMPQTSRVGESLMEAYGKKILSVVYWRFFVNLVFCGTISFIVAVILMLQGGINRRSARFHFSINLWMYAVLCALLITMALRLTARQQIHRICGRSIAVLHVACGSGTVQPDICYLYVDVDQVWCHRPLASIRKI